MCDQTGGVRGSAANSGLTTAVGCAAPPLDDPDDRSNGSSCHHTVAGGELTGERLKGSLEGAAGDWILMGSDGFARLDVRGTLHMVDDAFIYTRYVGLLELTSGITAVLEGGETPTNFGDQYFFTNPRLETGDEPYAWGRPDDVHR
jgi:hypothetical protein